MFFFRCCSFFSSSLVSSLYFSFLLSFLFGPSCVAKRSAGCSAGVDNVPIWEELLAGRAGKTDTFRGLELTSVGWWKASDRVFQGLQGWRGMVIRNVRWSWCSGVDSPSGFLVALRACQKPQKPRQQGNFDWVLSWGLGPLRGVLGGYWGGPGGSSPRQMDGCPLFGQKGRWMRYLR